MKTFLLTLKLVVLLVVFTLFSSKSFSQCGSPSTNMGTIIPAPCWQSQYVTGNSGTYAYWSFTATAGVQYEFSNCNGTSDDTYLRIYNSSWTELKTADDVCGMNAAFYRTNSTQWTCPSNGTYFIYLSDYYCDVLSYNQRLDYSCGANGNIDAGVSAIVSPATPVTEGVSTNVTVRIKNYSTISLTSAGIQWKVDNGSPVTFSGGWTGSALSTCTESANITIASTSFVFGTHTIKAWTYNPNGQPDLTTVNDTFTATFYVCKPPVAKFDVADTVCDGSPTVFMNYAAPDEPKTHKWYIDGIYQGNMVNLTYTFNGVGAYEVKLKTYGCNAMDSFVKTVNIITPPKAPIVDFVSDRNLVSIYDPINLLDLSTQCPSNWIWSIDPAISYAKGYPEPTYVWDLNSTENTQNPSLYFIVPGSYKVKLKVWNVNDSDSLVKDRYITVKAIATMCNTFVENSLYGYLTDDLDGAGYQGPAAATTCPLLIATCGDSIVLNFSEFSVNSGDYLRIYDGIDNTGTPMWDKSLLPKGWGNNMNMTNPLFKPRIVAKTGKMFIEWERIGHGSTVNYSTGGFTAEWIGYALNQSPPVASFQSPDTICSGTPVYFQNTSTGDRMDFIWDYDGAQTNTSNGFDGSFNYDPGTYSGNVEVVLLATNCAGSDEFRKTIFIDRPMIAPKAGFYADNLKPLAGVDEVQFTDTTRGCVEQWRWEISPSSFLFAGGTSNASQNPIIKFNDTVWYTIKLIATYNTLSDTAVEINYLKPVNYCTPVTVYLNPDIGISRVKIANMDNFSSIGDVAFTDYSQTKTIILDAQSEYEIIIERLTNFNAINWAVWIDYNIDGDYTDSGELVLQSPTLYSNQYIDTLKISAKILGTTRMRVGASYNTMSNTPCGPNQYGEYEEYKIFIRPDMTPPVLTLIGASTVNIVRCQQYFDLGATAWDNVSGNISSKIVPTTLLNVNNPGTYVIYYNVVDDQGNAATQIQRTVIVTEEIIPPELTLLGNAIDTVDVFSTPIYMDPGFITSDTCSGIKDTIITGNVKMQEVGTYIKTYTVRDQAKNQSTVTRKVVVVDTELPKITLLGSATIEIEVYSNFVDPGVTIYDNYCTGLQPVITGKVDMNTLGTYTIIYSVTDCNGNGPVSVTRTVKVVDTTNPKIEYQGSDTTLTIEVYDDYVAPSYLATDNYWPTLTTTVTGTFFQTFPSGKTNQIGSYTVIYTVTDGSGNSVSKTFVVHVVDTKKPVITILGLSPVNICRYETLNQANSAFSVTDNYDKNLTVTQDGSYIKEYLVYFDYGSYEITYNCKDASGNDAKEVVRSVYVKDCQLSVQEGGIDQYVRLYPNPNQGIFTIEVNKGNSATVKVMNSVGQIVKELNLQKTQMDKFDIDLSKQGNGIYFVRIMTDEGTVVKRVTITK